MSEYRVLLDERVVCETDWPPMAQTAWLRASSNRDAAQHGGEAIIEKDGVVLARVQPRTPGGHPWPDREAPEANWHDVVKSLLLLLREDGFGTREIADAMTGLGLETTRSRIDALRGSTAGKRTAVTPAEIVVLLQSVLNLYHTEP